MAIALQAALFCGRLSSQLAVQEKQNKKKEEGEACEACGWWLLTGDEFYNRVMEFDKAAADEELECKNRRKQREERAEAMAVWKPAGISSKSWVRAGSIV